MHAPTIRFVSAYCSLVYEVVWSRLYRSMSRMREPGEWTGLVVYAWSIAGLLALLPLITGDPRIPLHAWRLPEIFRVVVGIVPFCAAVGLLTPMMIDR